MARFFVSDLEVEFPGFTLHRLDRDYKTGGGVCAFVNNNFKCTRLERLSYISDSGFHYGLRYKFGALNH